MPVFDDQPASGGREKVRFSRAAGPNGDLTTSVQLTGPSGGLFAAGTTYTSAQVTAVFAYDQGCNQATITVHDLTRDANNKIVTAGFSVRGVDCVISAELRYRSVTPYAAWNATDTVDLGTFGVHDTGTVYGTATVSGLGPTPTTIGSIVFQPGGPAGAVTMVSGGTCAAGTVLAYGQACTIRLSGTPWGAAGYAGGTVFITDTTGLRLNVSVMMRSVVVSSGNFYPYGTNGPERVLDTRHWAGPFAPGATTVINPKPGAAALVLNVTAVNPSVDDFLTLYPSGSATPNASSINVPKGAIEANSVTVANGPDGVVVFNHAGTVDVVVDLIGYYAGPGGADDSNATGGQYLPHAPTRVLDTRTGGKQLEGGGLTRVAVDYGAAINPHVRALAVNFTVTNPKDNGFITAGYNPLFTQTSTLNFTPGETVANFAIVQTFRDNEPGARSGMVATDIQNRSPAGIDLIVDVIGYYDDGTTLGGLHYTPMAPTRILDTRTTRALGTGGQVTVTGPAAKALALNVTGVQPTVPTYLTVWPGGGAKPTASTLNLKAGEIRSNATIAGLGAGNTFNLGNFAGTTNAVVDVNGTFGPLGGESLPPVPAPRPIP